jgi:hypothetical protein
MSARKLQLQIRDARKQQFIVSLNKYNEPVYNEVKDEYVWLIAKIATLSEPANGFPVIDDQSKMSISILVNDDYILLDWPFDMNFLTQGTKRDNMINFINEKNATQPSYTVSHNEKLGLVYHVALQLPNRAHCILDVLKYKSTTQMSKRWRILKVQIYLTKSQFERDEDTLKTIQQRKDMELEESKAAIERAQQEAKLKHSPENKRSRETTSVSWEQTKKLKDKLEALGIFT